MGMMVCEALPPPSMQAVAQELATSAWLADGMDQNAGWLVFRDGRLSFVDHGGGVVFASEVSRVDEIAFPWYYWGVGCRIRVCGESYRVRFAPPFGGALSLRIQGLHAPAIDAIAMGASVEPHTVCATWRSILRR